MFNFSSTSFYLELTLFDIGSGMLSVMQATVQSNWLESSQISCLSNDKVAGSLQIQGVVDQNIEIGVINGVRKILVPVHQHVPFNNAWSTYGDPELVLDESAGVNEMWVEVIPPNQAVALSLKTRMANQDHLSRNDDIVYLDCIDFQRTYDELIRRGATCVAAPARMPFGWLSMFEDGDGRRYVLGQW